MSIDAKDTQAIDRAVAELREGCIVERGVCYQAGEMAFLINYHPSTNWQQAGELLEEMKEDSYISLSTILWGEGTGWSCLLTAHKRHELTRAPTPQASICLAYIEWKGSQQ